MISPANSFQLPDASSEGQRKCIHTFFYTAHLYLLLFVGADFITLISTTDLQPSELVMQSDCINQFLDIPSLLRLPHLRARNRAPITKTDFPRGIFVIK